MKPIFRYSPKDIYLILYTVFMCALPIAVAAYNPSVPWILLITVFHVWFLVNGQNSSLHHHTHWTTFNSSKLNYAYEIFLSMIFVIPQTAWKHSHLIHHRYVNDKPVDGADTKDPVSVYRYAENGELVNFWTYCFKSALRFNNVFALKINSSFLQVPKHIKQFQQEMLAQRLFILLIMLINFWYGVWLMIIYFMSLIVNNANSYGEHWGALNRRGDTTQDSIGIYSKWYNWFGFNAGLHQEHHHKPGVHWTKLPEVTPLLHPDRVIVKHGVHITNNPFWSHLVALVKGEKVYPK
jgi:fatty acid desaturase